MSTIEEKSQCNPPAVNNPWTVHLEDTVGAVFLGILAGIALIGWMRSEARYHELIVKRGAQ